MVSIISRQLISFKVQPNLPPKITVVEKFKLLIDKSPQRLHSNKKAK